MANGVMLLSPGGVFKGIHVQDICRMRLVECIANPLAAARDYFKRRKVSASSIGCPKVGSGEGPRWMQVRNFKSMLADLKGLKSGRYPDVDRSEGQSEN